MVWIENAMKGYLKFSESYIVFAIYLIIALATTLHHELWKDEAHHWLLGRDSEGFLSLIYNNRYEGHPSLWIIILFFIAKISANPLSMQIAHWFIASINVWLILFKSPFPKSITYLLPFTYFFLFEYQVISRNYALSILFIILICHLLCAPNLKLLALGAVLSLLANTHLFGLIFSAIIFIVLLFDIYLSKEKTLITRKYQLFVAICLLGFLIAGVQIIPPEDHFLTTNYNDASLLSTFRLNKLISFCFRGLFHMPVFWLEYSWNSNLFLHYLPIWLKGVTSLTAWFVPFLIFYRDRRLVFIFYSVTGLIALFAYFSPLLLAVRHSGLVFVVLVATFWLSYSKISRSETGLFKEKWRDKNTRIFKVYLLFLVLSGFIAISQDWRYPFSQSKNVIEFINEKDMDNLPILATQNNGQALSAYSEDQVFYIDRNELGSFAIWNTRSFIMDQSVMIKNIENYALTNDRFLISTEYIFTNETFENITELKLLKSFTNSLVSTEVFHLYHASTKQRSSATSQ